MNLLRLYDPSECGEDSYPPIWHEVIKHEVRQDAGDRCVRCLHPYAKGSGEWSACDERCTHEGPMRVLNEDGHLVASIANGEPDWHSHAFIGGAWTREARWRILTVHHLDGNKANCRWWNLAALCQRCHLTIQGRVRMERVYPFEHSAWFKPYVAGYYALTYLGEELDREQTEARLDELLGLELAA